MLQNDLLDKPCQVFKIDESGMPLDPKQMGCVYNRGDRNPLAPSSGVKSQITVVACVSSSGMCIPSMVILDRKILPAYFSDGEVPGSIYGLSPKGWIDQELFDIWFCNHFFAVCPNGKTIITPPRWSFQLILSRNDTTCSKRASNGICSAATHHTFLPTTRQGLFWAAEAILETRMSQFHV